MQTLLGRLWLAYDLFVEAKRQAALASLEFVARNQHARADRAWIARNNYEVMVNWLLFIAAGKSNGSRREMD